MHTNTCGIEAVSKLADGLVVDIAVLGNGRGVNLEHFHAPLLVWQADFHLAVQPTWRSTGGEQALLAFLVYFSLPLPLPLIYVIGANIHEP
jgi:hypothetical protein